MNKKPIAIIGAGPAGLAMAARVKKAQIEFHWFEKENNITPAWHRHYDRLHLHTVKRYSELPFTPFPKHYPKYVSRKQLVEYYEKYVQEQNIVPKLNCNITKIEKSANGFSITNSKNEIFFSEKVIMCTGFGRVPVQPQWPQQENFSGTIIHSKDYKNGKAHKGKKVLVVGIGNTGAEIALDLLEHGAEPTISVRSPVNVVPRDFLGRGVQESAVLLSHLPNIVADKVGKLMQKVVYGDLSPYGLEMEEMPPAQQIRETGKTPLIDLGTIKAIKEGKIKVVPDIVKFTSNGILFRNDEQLNFETVISATGYKPFLDKIITNFKEKVDGRGHPKTLKSINQEGLFFLGFDVHSNGLLQVIKEDSEKILNLILNK